MNKEKAQPAVLLKKLKLSWQKGLLNLASLGGFSDNNYINIFHDGDNAFHAIFQAINSAKQSIIIETYILAQDSVGLWIRDSLIKASIRGVKTTVIYDYFGSASLSRNFINPMLKAGINVLPFNPIWPWRRRGPLLFRNHRKIMIFDESHAFCGSMNISRDYAGPILGSNRFRDSIAYISGPAVKALLKITKESIIESKFTHKNKGEDLIFKNNIKSVFDMVLKKIFNFDLFPNINYSTSSKDSIVQVLRSNNRRNLNHIQKSIEESLNRAVDYCYFTTPYFLPYKSLNQAIINAARRGVDIRILTAGLSDIPLMRLASRYVYKKFLSHGVRIYEMNKKTLHAKLATIDGFYSTIGSYNLDHWSARRNLEVNISILDPQIALGLKQQFFLDLKLSQEINQERLLSRRWFQRIFEWFSYLLMRL